MPRGKFPLAPGGHHNRDRHLRHSRCGDTVLSAEGRRLTPALEVDTGAVTSDRWTRQRLEETSPAGGRAPGRMVSRSDARDRPAPHDTALEEPPPSRLTLALALARSLSVSFPARFTLHFFPLASSLLFISILHIFSLFSPTVSYFIIHSYIFIQSPILSHSFTYHSFLPILIYTNPTSLYIPRHCNYILLPPHPSRPPFFFSAFSLQPSSLPLFTKSSVSFLLVPFIPLGDSLIIFFIPIFSVYPLSFICFSSSSRILPSLYSSFILIHHKIALIVAIEMKLYPKEW